MKVIEILQKFPQWEAIPYAADFACQECDKSAIQGKDEYIPTCSCKMIEDFKAYMKGE